MYQYSISTNHGQIINSAIGSGIAVWNMSLNDAEQYNLDSREVFREFFESFLGGVVDSSAKCTVMMLKMADWSLKALNLKAL